MVLVRADSAYYGHDIIAACRRVGARFSVTARLTPAVVKAITGIDEPAWTPIRYPNAICDEDEQRWVSDAEVAEIGLHRVHRPPQSRARHRPADRAPGPAAQPAHRPGRAPRPSCSRSTATTPCSPTPPSRCWPRRPPTATTPSSSRSSPSSRTARSRTCPPGCSPRTPPGWSARAIAFNLTRAAGALAGGRHTRARTATLRARLINTPARLAHSAHRQVLHLPRDWPWEPGLDELFRRALHDPLPAAS